MAMLTCELNEMEMRLALRWFEIYQRKCPYLVIEKDNELVKKLSKLVPEGPPSLPPI